MRKFNKLLALFAVLALSVSAMAGVLIPAAAEETAVNIFDMTTSVQSEKGAETVLAVGTEYTVPLNESDTGAGMVYARGCETFAAIGWENNNPLAEGFTNPAFISNNLFVLAFKVPADATKFEIGGVFNAAASPAVAVSAAELGLGQTEAYASDAALAEAFGAAGLTWQTSTISTGGWGTYAYTLENPGEADFYVYVACNGTGSEYFGVTGAGQFNIQGNLTFSHNGTVWDQTASGSYLETLAVGFTDGSYRDYLVDTYMARTDGYAVSYNVDEAGGNVQANSYDGNYRLIYVDEEGNVSQAENRRPSYWVYGQYAVFAFDLSSYAEREITELALNFTRLFSAKVDVAFASELKSAGTESAFTGDLTDYEGSNVLNVDAAQNFFGYNRYWTNVYGSLGEQESASVALDLTSLYQDRPAGTGSDLLLVRLSSNSRSNFAGSTVTTTGILQALSIGINYEFTATQITVSGQTTSILIGEDYDNSGLTVTAQDASGSQITLSADQYTVDTSEVNFEEAGTYTVTVRYGDLTATYDLTVSLPAVTGITASTTKTTYTVGEELDLSAITVTAMRGESEENVTVTADMISGFDSSEAGEITITVTYEGQTDTITLTIEEAETTGGNSCSGCNSSVGAGSAMLGLLALAGTVIFRKKSA